VLNALLGNALGLLASAFARTEFQAVQFMPAFLLPQILLSGIFGPRDAMTPVLKGLSDVLPMTYAYDGLSRVAASATIGRSIAIDLAVIAGSVLIALVLGAATLRRRTG
jgi:ABC-2 type transport system permease protein